MRADSEPPSYVKKRISPHFRIMSEKNIILDYKIINR